MRRVAIVLLLGLLISPASSARASGAVRTADDLLALAPAELEALYRGGRAVGVPDGRVRGTVLTAPGTGRAKALSRGARVLWQGKVVDAANGRAVNRFLGVPVVAGRLYLGNSLLDGAPALVLDYRETSHVYRKYRDEIREVAPGLYLGRMMDVSRSPATLKLQFALEAR
jgi:hypothetical protein